MTASRSPLISRPTHFLDPQRRTGLHRRGRSFCHARGWESRRATGETHPGLIYIRFFEFSRLTHCPSLFISPCTSGFMRLRQRVPAIATSRYASTSLPPSPPPALPPSILP